MHHLKYFQYFKQKFVSIWYFFHLLWQFVSWTNSFFRYLFVVVKRIYNHCVYWMQKLTHSNPKIMMRFKIALNFSQIYWFYVLSVKFYYGILYLFAVVFLKINEKFSPRKHLFIFQNFTSQLIYILKHIKLNFSSFFRTIMVFHFFCEKISHD